MKKVIKEYLNAVSNNFKNLDSQIENEAKRIKEARERKRKEEREDQLISTNGHFENNHPVL